LLILASGFHEYTTPAKPKAKLKEHFFSMPQSDYFWIAGIQKQGCF